MVSDFLLKILEHKKSVIKQNKAFYASIKSKLSLPASSTRYRVFHKKISHPGQMNLIAEIKKASPSKGMIREEFDLLDIARVYMKHNAAAISVLTEDKYFLGKPSYLQKVGETVNIPLLMKDFFIDEDQVYEARYYGASAILLIVNILKDDQLKRMLELASRLDMDCLVEVHHEEELRRALMTGADIIGINNRDLHTFEIDLKTCERLIPLIPKDKVIVAESGIQTHEDVERLKNLGAHAVLIGETFMKSTDIGQKIDEVMLGIKKG